MNNAKKEYVSPEVNVIAVDKDVITSSGDIIDFPEVEVGSRS